MHIDLEAIHHFMFPKAELLMRNVNEHKEDVLHYIIK